jgi:hypothetical protein
MDELDSSFVGNQAIVQRSRRARGCSRFRTPVRRCRARACASRSGRGRRPIPRWWGSGIPRRGAPRPGGPRPSTRAPSGPGAARTRARAYAAGRYVKVLDGDGRLTPGARARGPARLEAGSALEWTASFVRRNLLARWVAAMALPASEGTGSRGPLRGGPGHLTREYGLLCRRGMRQATAQSAPSAQADFVEREARMSVVAAGTDSPADFARTPAGVAGPVSRP